MKRRWPIPYAAPTGWVPWLGGAVRGDNTIALGGRDKAGGRIPRGDQRWVHMMSGASEHLVALCLDVPFEYRTYAPDPGWDCELPDGHRVDVKWTDEDWHQLLCAADSKSKGAIYVLVTGTDPERLVIRGWTSREKLRSRTVHFSGPDRKDSYGLPQSDLWSFSVLLQRVEAWRLRRAG